MCYQSQNWSIFHHPCHKIEVNSNALFLSTFGVKIDVKNERKRVSRMCENAYLSIKNPKASSTLKQALDPGCRLLTLLTRLYFTMSATFGLRSWGPPLTKSWIRTCRYFKVATKLHKPFCQIHTVVVRAKKLVQKWYDVFKLKDEFTHLSEIC